MKLEENDQEGLNDTTERKAIVAWNRRAEPTGQTRKINENRPIGGNMTEYVTKDQVLEILRKHYPYATLKEEHAMYKAIQELKALPGVKINES